MNKVLLSIGSNAPDRARRMEEAIGWLCGELHDCSASPVYETPEYSGRYPAYFNCVAEGLTAFGADEFNRRLKDYERSCGRTAESKLTGVVPVDFDLVMFNGDMLRPVEFGREYFAIGYRMLHG